MAITAAEAKSGKYTYYTRQTLLKRGKGDCKTSRLNVNVLTESNNRDVVRIVGEEMDVMPANRWSRWRPSKGELEDVKKRLGLIWHAIETTADMADASRTATGSARRSWRIVAEEARALLKERRQLLDSASSKAEDMCEFLMTSELTETSALVHSFVEKIEVKPGKTTIVHSIPTPVDGSMGGAGAAETAHNRRAMNLVQSGGLSRARQVYVSLARTG